MTLTPNPLKLQMQYLGVLQLLGNLTAYAAVAGDEEGEELLDVVPRAMADAEALIPGLTCKKVGHRWELDYTPPPINLDSVEVSSPTVLPDGSAFVTASYPLPADHWLYLGAPAEDPPAPMRLGKEHPLRAFFAPILRAAGMYAVKAAMCHGKEMDFDPDAMLQNLEIGMFGYYTPDGFSHADEVLTEGDDHGVQGR